MVQHTATDDEIERTLEDQRLALSVFGPEPAWKLSTFMPRRNAWAAELHDMLGMDVGLELLDPAYLFDPIQGGFIELWPQPDK